jgi:hypothetical protein
VIGFTGLGFVVQNRSRDGLHCRRAAGPPVGGRLRRGADRGEGTMGGGENFLPGQ